MYGFIHFNYDLVYDIIDHPYFQRLRRISQVGLTHYVYPGAVHTRFHHAIGATHLMSQALTVLNHKGVPITPEEEEGAILAMLLHDIGHGPYSHALEGIFVHVDHEDLSLRYMQHLNVQFDNRLDVAIQIFQNKHPKPFLHQLLHGQLDMDRLDYLNRDSFYTGVAEGVIGYDRIIKMLDVRDLKLVVEEKAIHSIEKFLMARRIMYWQVYLHKTVLSAEQMLIKFFEDLYQKSTFTLKNKFSRSLKFFMEKDFSHLDHITEEVLQRHAALDEHDIMGAIKITAESNDKLLSFLANSLLNRNLFKIELSKTPFKSDLVLTIRQKIEQKLNLTEDLANMLIIEGKESNNAYSNDKEIQFLMKNGTISPFSEVTDFKFDNTDIIKYFLCYPKLIC